MVDRNCGVPEERWADWHLGKLPAELSAALERHLDTCPECRWVCRQWGEWRGAGTKDDASEQNLMPSDRIRRSLRRRLRKRALRRRFARWPAWSVLGAVTAVLLLAGVAMLKPEAGQVKEAVGLAALPPPMAYAEKHQPEGATLMAQPDTRVYSAAPAFEVGLPEVARRTAVTVWVNGRTQEVFVLLEGLLPAESRDVQAWGAENGGLTNLGLLEFHQAQAHLYSHIRNLPEAGVLSITIEPKGGSLRPTAPETARVRLAGGLP